MNVPIVKMSVVAIIEECLWIELVLSTDSLEMHRCLHTAIPVNVPRWCIADYPLLLNILVKILVVVCYLVNYHRWHESLPFSSGEDEIYAP